MELIDDEKFIAAMRAVVDERGRDYVYPKEWKDEFHGTCRYVRPDGAGCACIIGVALGLAGVTLAELDAHEYKTADKVLCLLRRVDVSPRIRRAARAAQDCQDVGKTWGEALDVFLSRVPS